MRSSVGLLWQLEPSTVAKKLLTPFFCFNMLNGDPEAPKMYRGHQSILKWLCGHKYGSYDIWSHLLWQKNSWPHFIVRLFLMDTQGLQKCIAVIKGCWNGYAVISRALMTARAIYCGKKIVDPIFLMETQRLQKCIAVNKVYWNGYAVISMVHMTAGVIYCGKKLDPISLVDYA